MWRHVRGELQLLGSVGLVLLAIAVMRPGAPPEPLREKPVLSHGNHLRAYAEHRNVCPACSQVDFDSASLE